MLDLSKEPEFDGSDYKPAIDKKRLTGQLLDIFKYIEDGKWFTLGEVARYTGHPEASISAQLRHLRKDRFGNHIIEKTRLDNGLWAYRYDGLSPTEESAD